MRLFLAGLALAAGLAALPTSAGADDFVVYSVTQALDMGGAGAEQRPPKDFYVNLGTRHGAREGAVLDVLRRAPTYDLSSQKLFREMLLPIGKIKVIHAEESTAVARLVSLGEAEKTPVSSPRGVMIGDIVKLAE